MAANFPNNPNNGDTFTSNGVTFTWNGEAWKQSASPGVKGQKGDKGEKGQKGEKGEKGQKGVKGDIGPTGGTGGTGTKGEKGEKGVKGEPSTVAGPTGPTGPTGPSGSSVKGEKGEKGQKGVKGDLGPTGPTGPTGSGTGTADKIFEGNTEAEVIDTGANGHFKVTTEGSERLRIDKDGKVGINSSIPSATLDIQDVTGTDNDFPVLLLGGGGNDNGDLAVNTGEILQAGHWDRSTGTFTERFRFGTQGALGIAGSNYGS